MAGSSVSFALSGIYRRTAAADPLEAPLSIVTYIWLLGMVGMVGYACISYFQLKKKLASSLRLRENIFIADHASSSFVMGFVRPRIYLSSGLAEKEQEYIILHEMHHIKRCDHIFKALAFVALSIHWFNPLVWVAFLLSSRDMGLTLLRKTQELWRVNTPGMKSLCYILHLQYFWIFWIPRRACMGLERFLGLIYLRFYEPHCSIHLPEV